MTQRDIPQQPYDQEGTWTADDPRAGTAFEWSKDDGTPAYYDRDEHATTEGEGPNGDDQGQPPRAVPGELLARVGDAVGWASLSAFARERLMADDETATEEGGEGPS